MLRHRGADYHLYPNLVLPAAPGSAPGPDSEPHVVVCSACFSRLPCPKAASAVSGSTRPPAESESDKDCSSDSDSSEPSEPQVDAGGGGAAASKPLPLPFNSVAAGYEYGRLRDLPPLTLIEKSIIAKVLPYGSIVKLKEWQGTSQLALTGQTICFPSDGQEAAASFAANRFKTQFPFHSNEKLAEHVRVAFIGPADKAGDYIQVLGMPDGPLCYTVAHVVAWLRVLEQTHPDYHGLEIPRECDLEATLAALRQTIFDQAQVVHDETARFMENTKIGTDVAGVRSVFADGEPLGEGPDLDENQGAGAASAAAGPAPAPAVHLNKAGVPDRLPLVMSDVVIIDGLREEEDPDLLLLKALNTTLRKPPAEDDSDALPTEPVDSLFCRRAEDPVNEFEEQGRLLACAFPHVFPFGVGIPRSYLSTNFTRYLMLHHSNSFANEPSLYFLLFNQLHRHTNCRSTSLRVKAQKKHIDAVTRITKADDFMPRLEAANANPDSVDAKRLMASLHPHIITLGARAPFSPAARKASFNHFLAAMNRCLSPCSSPPLGSCVAPV